MNRENLGIIISGGGTRSVYAAGALTALAEKHGITRPRVVIAGSGGVGTAAYYLTGQLGEMRRICLKLLATPKFISLFRIRKIMDVDYLVREIFAKQAPLDVGAFPKMKTRFFVATIRCETSEPHFFLLNENTKDAWDILRAGQAMPIGYNQSVDIQGEEYMDGMFGFDISQGMEKMHKEGAGKVVFIDCTSPLEWTRAFWLTLSKWFLPESCIRDAVLDLKQHKPRKSIRQKKDMFILRPKKMRWMPTFIIWRRALSRMYFLGYKDVEDDKKLASFLARGTSYID